MSNSTKNCPFCKSALPYEAKFCTSCMTVLNQKKNYKVLKVGITRKFFTFLLVAVLLLTVVVLCEQIKFNKDYEYSEYQYGIIITKINKIPKDGIYKFPEKIDGKMVLRIDKNFYTDYEIRANAERFELPKTITHFNLSEAMECENLEEIYVFGDDTYVYKDQSSDSVFKKSVFIRRNVGYVHNDDSECFATCMHNLQAVMNG